MQLPLDNRKSKNFENVYMAQIDILKVKTLRMSIWATFAKISSCTNIHLYSNLFTWKFNIFSKTCRIILVMIFFSFLFFFNHQIKNFKEATTIQLKNSQCPENRFSNICASPDINSHCHFMKWQCFGPALSRDVIQYGQNFLKNFEISWKIVLSYSFKLNSY